ncbi:MAG: phosphoribosylaminoimidazolesuccinocarboxamide synthase, partial [Pseudomonadota bacterium]
KKRTALYTGKAKTIYEGPDDATVIQYFRDDATAFNKKKHDIIEGKGVLNNFISAFIMETLEGAGIKTHFVKTLNMREQLVKKLEIIPLEVVVRRKAAGSICARYGVEEGKIFEAPLVEFFLKDDEKDDPLITPEVICALEIIDLSALEDMANSSLRVTSILYGMFAAIGIELIDLKLEFGKLRDPEFDDDDIYDIFLADEISPDNCRLRCMKTGESLDKDIFRKGEGDLTSAYREVAKRLGLLPQIQEGEGNKITKLHADIRKSTKKK